MTQYPHYQERIRTELNTFCRRLSQVQIIHRKVNDSRHFKDPLPGEHTNTLGVIFNVIFFNMEEENKVFYMIFKI